MLRCSISALQVNDSRSSFPYIAASLVGAAAQVTFAVFIHYWRKLSEKEPR